MRFTLSNAQQKELLVRGQPLIIALPLQQDCETDEAAMQLAREWLVLPTGVRIASAEVDEVIVSAPLAGPGDTLAGVLGAIVPIGRESEIDRSRSLLSRHVVILAIVRGPAERHPLKPPAWPGGKIHSHTAGKADA